MITGKIKVNPHATVKYKYDGKPYTPVNFQKSTG